MNLFKRFFKKKHVYRELPPSWNDQQKMAYWHGAKAYHDLIAGKKTFGLYMDKVPGGYVEHFLVGIWWESEND